MARRVVTQLISDLSGAEIVGGGGETIEFAYRGVSYTIDLTSEEAAEFDEAIAPWLGNATQRGRSAATRGSRATKAAGSSGDAKAVREWARAQGLDVPPRGRIPGEIRAQYEAAN